MFKTIAALCVLIGGVIYFQFGTLSPCSMLREQARQHDGLAALLPDSVVDTILAAQFGALNPARCVSLLVSANRPKVAAPAVQAAPVSAPAQPPIVTAQKESQNAIAACRERRLRGELKSYVESTSCSNPAIIAAYKRANYRFMDLIDVLTNKRMEVAIQIDQGLMTEAQAQQELERTQQNLAGVERNRTNPR